MKLTNFSFIVTDRCNFNCSYCFQKKGPNDMALSTVDKAVDFFYPYFNDKTYIIFFGGEPLLNFAAIRHAVSRLEERKKNGRKELLYDLTTNGSRIDEDILRYFDHHRFRVMLSFDGPGQDGARAEGSLAHSLDLIKRMPQYPGISFSTNSVFTAGSVSQSADAMRFVVESGSTEALLSVSTIEPWDAAALETLEQELDRLTAFLLDYYKDTGEIPVTYFRDKKKDGKPRVFTCDGGFHRLSVTPDETVWGCYLFHDYLRDKKAGGDHRAYSFGSLGDFIKNHETVYPAVLENYAGLRQDRFICGGEFCFLCDTVETCGACPVDAAYPTGAVGRIPPWTCRVHHIKQQAKAAFHRELEKLAGEPHKKR